MENRFNGLVARRKTVKTVGVIVWAIVTLLKQGVNESAG
jgi:hypothetical protein